MFVALIESYLFEGKSGGKMEELTFILSIKNIIINVAIISSFSLSNLLSTFFFFFFFVHFLFRVYRLDETTRHVRTLV